ncbi:hypothetical protein [Lentibacillus amyloliquefaciens]|uniref:DUF4440 domain-containing protein n=1 Tax=Lentibacillus amyloliquefaciens TaxID=1472767 RepID=A0A0U4FWZ0_9BACI|nr:hypothetical protein [Lentibacillus amyloliquefaciens]ALX50277.1 hypothetical protein AOX59_17850 [Lentibacillus amyloliquefaciens]
MRKIAAILVLAIIGAFIFMLIHQSADDEATEAVTEFYSYEQEADFSASWEMFHPIMKEKFDKIDYLQDRAHVFLNHFGVETFSFTVGEATEIEDWTIENDAEVIDTVYQVPVSLGFKGKYGNFSLVQNTFATKVKGEWKILWDYKK